MADLSRVAVLFGGPSPEHDVSVLTGLLAAHELLASRGRTQVQGLYWSKSGSFHLVDPNLEAEAFLQGVPDGSSSVELTLGAGGGFTQQRRGRFGSGRDPLELDAVIICCHGGPGEDGTLQAALDLASIAYAGPSVMGAALGMDKLATSGILEAGGVEVLERRALGKEGTSPLGSGPYIVKPRYGGSSIGIDVVEDLDTARMRLDHNVHLRRGAVIEPYRPDLFDLQIAIRSWPTLQLSEIERPIRTREGAEILDYRDKYVGGEGMHAAPRDLPALIPDALAARLREAAARAAELLQVRGVTRVDFLSDGNDELYLNELNTIPGSLSRHLFAESGCSFGELLASLLDEAVSSPSAHYSSAGADGTVLRSAGSISSKLG